jgi:hypothetical protein
MVASVVAPELRVRGFRKRRNAFSRPTSDGWTVIDFQASQFGTRDDVSFTINLGVSFAELQATDEGPPSLGRAHMRQRIGRLLDGSRDRWWPLDPGPTSPPSRQQSTAPSFTWRSLGWNKSGSRRPARSSGRRSRVRRALAPCTTERPCGPPGPAQARRAAASPIPARSKLTTRCRNRLIGAPARRDGVGGCNALDGCGLRV